MAAQTYMLGNPHTEISLSLGSGIGEVCSQTGLALRIKFHQTLFQDLN